MNDEQVVRLEHVWTTFGERVVHQDINLSLERGEILGVVGGSGSGKTTLLREMIGLQAPSRGEVFLLGQPLGRGRAGLGRALRNRCGVLFQGGALFSALSVFDNIALPLRELRLLEEDLVARMVGLRMEMVGLDPLAAHLAPAELSGGMVKRAALARALALEPELLLLDEPTSGLDPPSGEAFVRLVKALHRDLGLSIVLVTHDLDTLVDLCHRIAVLADARLVAFGPLQVVRQATHPFARSYFGGARARRVLGEARPGGAPECAPTGVPRGAPSGPPQGPPGPPAPPPEGPAGGPQGRGRGRGEGNG